MLKRFYVTVTYDLYAHSEEDATGQVLNNRVEPETVDVDELTVHPIPKLEVVAF